MTHPGNRRAFLRTSLATAASSALPSLSAPAATDAAAFSFVLLGDLHFDKIAHHDMAWIEKHKGGDLGQIRNYSRITADIMPRLFATVRDTVAELNRTPDARCAFVLQVGDLVEGLCGTEELAARQNREALDFVRAASLGVPFLFAKGNHDVTGDGAPAAFLHVLQPHLAAQAAAFGGAAPTTGACYSIEHGGALFCFFDAYESASLDWLEAALARRTAQHCFVTIHPPVVPYGARATWHLYSSARDRTKRERLLEMLGKHRAFVLGGHIHKFNALVRDTPGGGRFAQLAVSSVIGAPTVSAKDVLRGIGEYTGDQIRVEPAHSPDTAAERRAVYDSERPFVRSFDYADLPGYAVLTVRGATVEARIYSGVSREVWRTVDLPALLAA